MSQANKAVVERWGEEIWNGGDLAVVDEIIAEGYVHHSSLRGDMRGRGALREGIGRWRAALPDMRFTKELLADGDRVVQHWTCKGTHKGPWQGVPGTGKAVTFSGVTIFRIAGGKIVESWAYWDVPFFLKQVGKPLE